MNRREFFRRMAATSQPLRPPWALAEPGFAQACDSCGDCLVACPQAIIAVDSGKRPVVNFATGGCSFCGECTAACRRGAFGRRGEGERPWALVARVADSCMETRGIACRACESVCAEAAFSFRPGLSGRNQVRVDAKRCSGCGCCVSVCPVAAIAVGHGPIQANEENAA